MSYLINTKYNIKFYQYDKIEESYFETINLLINKFPFKWEKFINSIIDNKKYCYIKDTSLIINLYLLEKEDVEMVFIFLKNLLSTKGIKKIVYKKEFMIAHFYSDKTIEVFKYHNLWQAITYYFTIKNNFKNVKIYLGGLLTNNSNDIEKIDLIIENKNKFYLFNTNKIINTILDDNYNQYFIYLFNNEYVFKLKTPKINYSFNEKTRINTIKNIVKNEIIS